MNPFDELPRRDQNHEIEDQALAAFQKRLADSGCFILQASDRKDYGTDCQIEVVAGGQATNVRVHVQVKGTARNLNADGSLSVSVERANLNYLLMQPYSFYACYHVPTGSLRICLADTVLQQYEHDGRSWTDQSSVTVTFTREMTTDRLCKVAALVRSGARSSRDRRVAQTAAGPKDLPNAILDAAPEVHVPADQRQAATLLQQLYDQNADDVISTSFERFAAALGDDHDFMGIPYMSEINLGMARRTRHPERIAEGIAFFQRQLASGRFQAASLHYTIGNAYSAVPDDEQAKLAYQAALADPALIGASELAAQIHKNLGTSFERLGDQDSAVEHYCEALRLDSNLAEAHNAMGNHLVRIGRYKDALNHFDQVAFVDRNQGKMTAVSGWRVNVLFNLDQGAAAFREINALTGQADRYEWIWPWCLRLVASFGRTTIDNAVHARAFWRRYVQAHPDSSQGRWELLMSNFYLRGQGYDLKKTYAEFRDEFDRHIANVSADDAALPWDRLGHWAQENGDWAEAERCFRKAYDLEGGHYGYCLGTALNFLDRFDESLPILLEQAKALQPDAMSWFQVGVAYAHLGQAEQAIDAFHQAVTLDPEYAAAMFELGGVHWNSGDHAKAKQAWLVACERFPDHELVSQVKAFLQ
jgi:tetratricopeptide (TPR) repeat protein